MIGCGSPSNAETTLLCADKELTCWGWYWDPDSQLQYPNCIASTTSQLSHRDTVALPQLYPLLCGQAIFTDYALHLCIWGLSFWVSGCKCLGIEHCVTCTEAGRASLSQKQTTVVELRVCLPLSILSETVMLQRTKAVKSTTTTTTIITTTW